MVVEFRIVGSMGFMPFYTMVTVVVLNMSRMGLCLVTVSIPRFLFFYISPGLTTRGIKEDMDME